MDRRGRQPETISSAYFLNSVKDTALIVQLTGSPTPVVHVVDDDLPFRRSVSRLLEASGYQVVLYASAEQLLERPPGPVRGCILLDLRMPGLDGLQLQARLASLQHGLPIIFLTGYGDIPATVRAIKGGAEDFLAKPVARQSLLDAITRALARYDHACEQQQRIEALRSRVASLTPREHEVFALIVRGKLNKQVAYELGTSERTVKAHRHSIMQELEVRSIAQAVAMAERLSMLDQAAAETV